MTSTSQDPRAWQRPEDRDGSAAARPASARLVDPEDDVPSHTYTGEAATTAIPRYDAQPAPQPAYGLLGDPEPLPYVQPNGRHSGHPAEPAEVGTDPLTDDRVRAAGKRGTQDLGLMLIRVGLGALLIAHGLQKALGLWGGSGLDGFQQSLADLGYQHSGILTYVGAGGQIAAGLLLVLGLFTPLAAAAAVAYLVNALLAAVVAQPNAKWGEVPCAFVELKPGVDASEADIIAFCRSRMTGFKTPKAIVFGEIPKTSTGKIQKFMLRDRVK